MAYIGNQPTSVAFLTDQFSGNGSTTAFTMSVAPASTSSILVAVTGVVQDPSTYSVVGTTLTFSAAPPSGTGNISVRYLGIPASGVTTTAYRTVTDFTATAGQTTFTPPSYTVGYIDVYRNGSRLGAADYTASNGTTVVLAAAASAGDLIQTESFYVSSVLNAIPSVGGAISATYLDTGNQNGTGAMVVPSGTTAQRPSAPSNGMMRYNTSTSTSEIYEYGGWNNLAAWYSVDYLVVAGGGGGGAAGGGAGGLLTGSSFVIAGSPFAVVVGSGGAGAPKSSAASGGSIGGNGNYSSFISYTALGGGRGGIQSDNVYERTGASGGSGGGSTIDSTGAVVTPGAPGTAGQGYAGGSNAGAANYGSGGGGGAGAIGATGTTTNGGNGGVGLASSISGSSVYYAGGGGAGGYSAASPGSGGNGGGGSGGTSGLGGNNATANTGGGGGGGTYNNTAGGNGGSGIVIIRYLGSQRGTGGTVTSSGGYTIHTFTSSGTFTA